MKHKVILQVVTFLTTTEKQRAKILAPTDKLETVATCMIKPTGFYAKSFSHVMIVINLYGHCIL